MNDEHGGGSLTALPIIETQAADISAYIPTNVISITDGQLFFETDLFNAGFRPAINVGLSVSRVGGDAQTKVIREVVRGLRLDLQQYRELAAFAQFGGSDLDKLTLQQLRRGERLTEMLKQPQYAPVPMDKEAAILFAGTRGYLDDIPKESVTQFERDLYRFMETQYRQLSERILGEGRKWDKELEGQLKAMLEDFKKTHTYGAAKPAPPEAPKEQKQAEARA
jgi:F-type H+-transporting ATPase subunit alpha